MMIRDSGLLFWATLYFTTIMSAVFHSVRHMSGRLGWRL